MSSSIQRVYFLPNNYYLIAIANRDQDKAFFVQKISSVYNATINLPARPSQTFPPTLFSSQKSSDIPLEEYIARIVDLCNCSKEALIMSLIYTDRFLTNKPEFLLNTTNIHRLLLTSLRIANKFQDGDSGELHGNGFFSYVGGVENQELNGLEAELLFGLNFSLLVHESEYQAYQRALRTFQSPAQIL